MTVVANPTELHPRTGAPALPERPGPVRRYLRETGLLVGRGLRMIPRVPERLSDVTIQPVLFTLLFLYVFGSAIHIPGQRYQDFLLPGLIAQQIAFGVMGSGTAAATDLTSGVVDRFRSLPITRLAIVTSQIVGQVIEQILGLLIVAGLGLALGWRPHASAAGWLALVGLTLLGLVAFTSFGTLIGSLVRSTDAVQGITFPIVLPLSFLAGTFVPISGMQEVLRWIGEWDPISAFVAATRHLTQGTAAHGSWQLEHPIIATVGWSILILLICLPASLRRFGRRS